MIEAVLLVIAFVLVAAGLKQSFEAKQSDRAFWGLTRLGVILMSLSFLSLILGVAKDIADSRQSAYRDQMLKEMHAQIVGISESTRDPLTAKRLGRIVERMKAPAYMGREGNFELSDFSRSVFRRGNFSEASFEESLFAKAYFGQAQFPGAIFRGAQFATADLRGADLSHAVIDSMTKLPLQAQMSAFNPIAAPDVNRALRGRRR